MAAARAYAGRAGDGLRAAWERVRATATDWPLDRGLFVLALALFAVTRLIGLERFPIYFFTDEAIQAVHASDFVDNGFRDEQGRRFPTYFQNATYWNLSTSVYAQIIPTQLFGHSVFATRATSAMIALTAAAAVSLTLRDVFKVRAWWVAGLFLTVTPAFFFHSRTAFETVIATSMYAWFLYFYLRYVVTQRAWSLLVGLVFGALAFYSYAAMQMVVVATGAALGLSNVKLHVSGWRASCLGLALLVLLAAPYLRFYIDQGQEPYLHLRTLESYWVEPGLSVEDKLDRFSDEYRLGFTPSYWFGTRNMDDLERHQMKGYGHISAWAAPFFFLGLAYCVYKARSAHHRALLIALALAPLGAALVSIQITRALVMVVPAALFAGLGAALVIEWLSRRVAYDVLATAAFTLFAFGGAYMLGDALRDGGVWYQDYGIYGMNYGGRQVSAEIRAQLDASPERRVVLSPAWANGTDTVMQFFLGDEPRFALRAMDDYRFRKLEIVPGTVFVLPPWEFKIVDEDPRFEFQVLKTIPYPNGQPGFYVANVGYSPEADAIFAREAEDRRKPVTAPLSIGGAPATVTHSRLDIGTLAGMFDNDMFTLGRTAGANPMVVDITFEAPREFTSVTLKARTVRHLRLVVRVHGADDGEPREYSLTRDPVWEEETVVTLPLEGAPVARRIRLEVSDLNSPPDDGNIHVREFALE